MLGTYVNTAAVIIGSLIGLALHQRFPEAFAGKEAADAEGAEVQ